MGILLDAFETRPSGGTNSIMLNLSEETPSVWVALKYSLFFNFLIILIPVIPGLLDILTSSRQGYSNFQWGYFHQISLATQKIFLFGFNAAFPRLNDYLIYGVFCIVFAVISYHLGKNKFDSRSDRSKYMAIFFVSFPIMAYVIQYAAVFFLFTVSVLKFGFV